MLPSSPLLTAIELSLIVPVYNERESLPILLGEIDQAARDGRLDLEVVFVDDGSRDGSWQVIAELAEKSPWMHGLRLRKNFGKTGGAQWDQADFNYDGNVNLQDFAKLRANFGKSVPQAMSRRSRSVRTNFTASSSDATVVRMTMASVSVR